MPRGTQGKFLDVDVALEASNFLRKSQFCPSCETLFSGWDTSFNRSCGFDSYHLKNLLWSVNFHSVIRFIFWKYHQDPSGNVFAVCVVSPLVWFLRTCFHQICLMLGKCWLSHPSIHIVFTWHVEVANWTTSFCCLKKLHPTSYPSFHSFPISFNLFYIMCLMHFLSWTCHIMMGSWRPPLTNYTSSGMCQM